MDMKKIGSFLKQLRKEKGFTQEQLAEKFGVAGRTVSRWENASNMPDLSVLIQIAEFFDVEIKEILEGERKSENMDKELKETFSKVADYTDTQKEKISKITLNSFLTTILVGTLILLVQFIVFKDIRFIIGEAIILFIGSITAIILTVYNGLWNAMSKEKSKPIKDLIISVIMSAVFTFAVAFVLYQVSSSVQKTIVYSACFFVLISVIGFIVLRVLSLCSNKREGDTESLDKHSKEQ